MTTLYAQIENSLLILFHAPLQKDSPPSYGSSDPYASHSLLRRQAVDLSASRPYVFTEKILIVFHRAGVCEKFFVTSCSFYDLRQSACLHSFLGVFTQVPSETKSPDVDSNCRTDCVAFRSSLRQFQTKKFGSALKRTLATLDLNQPDLAALDLGSVLDNSI